MARKYQIYCSDHAIILKILIEGFTFIGHWSFYIIKTIVKLVNINNKSVNN